MGSDGKGQEFWQAAGSNFGDGATVSSGWFIDRVEGFRRHDNTSHYFGVNVGVMVNEFTHPGGPLNWQEGYGGLSWCGYNWGYENYYQPDYCANNEAPGGNHVDNGNVKVTGTGTGMFAASSNYLGISDLNGPYRQDPWFDDSTVPDIRRSVLRVGTNGFDIPADGSGDNLSSASQGG